MSAEKHIYEVYFVMKKGEEPRFTHTSAMNEQEAANKVAEKYKALKVIEVIKM